MGSIFVSWCSLSLYKLRIKSVLKNNFPAKLSYLMKLLNKKYEPQISRNYSSFDLNLHSKAYRKPRHQISGCLLPSFLFSINSLINSQAYCSFANYSKKHSHKEIQSTQFSTGNISKYVFYSCNNTYQKTVIWTTQQKDMKRDASGTTCSLITPSRPTGVLSWGVILVIAMILSKGKLLPTRFPFKSWQKTPRARFKPIIS